MMHLQERKQLDALFFYSEFSFYSYSLIAGGVRTGTREESNK